MFEPAWQARQCLLTREIEPLLLQRPDNGTETPGLLQHRVPQHAELSRVRLPETGGRKAALRIKMDVKEAGAGFRAITRQHSSGVSLVWRLIAAEAHVAVNTEHRLQRVGGQ